MGAALSALFNDLNWWGGGESPRTTNLMSPMTSVATEVVKWLATLGWGLSTLNYFFPIPLRPVSPKLGSSVLLTFWNLCPQSKFLK